MVASKTQTTKKTITSTRQGKPEDLDTLPPGFKAWVRRGGLPTIPLALIAIIGWYYVLTHLANLPAVFVSPYPNLFIQPTFIALLVTVFSSVYVYKFLRGNSIKRYARVIGYIFTVLGVAVLAGLVGGILADASGQTCTGLFGVRTDCSSVYKFGLYVYFLNPFSLLLYEVFSVTGVVALLAKRN